jgi:hypothetical protein
MLSARFATQARVVLLAAIAFFIPWPFLYSAWALVGFTIVTVFSAHWPTVWQNLRSRRSLWAPILFFLLYAASYFWSEHKDTAEWAISSKLAFLLLPVALGAGPPVSDTQLRWILRAAVAGVIVIGTYCIAHAYGGWRETGDATLFFYHKLVTGREGHKIGLEANAVYMALYAYIALTILVGGMVSGARRWSVLLTWLTVLPVAVFFVLLSSRTLLLLFALLPVPAFLWHRLRNRRRSRLWLLGVAILVLATGTFIFSTDNPVRKRFADIARTGDIQEAFLPDYRTHDQKFNNLTTRLFLWRVGLETAEEHNLWWRGAGAGDVHYLTDARMDALGIRDIYNESSPSYFHGTNMHNMPLQVLLTLGILGVALLLWILAAPIIHRMTGSEGILWQTLAITFALFMAQEAAFQTQAGIVPFAFFTSLFWNRYWQVKKVPIRRTVKSV